MPIVSLVFAGIAACIHVLFFFMESILWMKPNIHKAFGVSNETDAEKFKLTYFNQGFYNLFLAIGVFIGIGILQCCCCNIVGITLIIFCCASMLGASIVLFVSKPSMIRGVILQGLCPLIAIACWYFCR